VSGDIGTMHIRIDMHRTPKLPQQKKNSESPNKQFVITARARVVVRRMRSQDHRALAFECDNTRVWRCNSFDVQESRMAQGFLSHRLLYVRR
jgi:hypothetical protein